MQEQHVSAVAARKAIPPTRERLQSRLLVLFLVPALLWVGWKAVAYAGHQGTTYLATAVAASLFLGLAAWRLRAATPPAAACGALICFDLTVVTANPGGGSLLRSGLSPLILLFVLTHRATRFHRSRKATTESDEERRGRNAAQVIANLGIAALVFPISQIPMLAALAEATADTVSSEVGQAIGGTPLFLLNLRRVPPGTDGAISAAGTLAGIGAAFAVALAGGPALGMESRRIAHVLVSATAGLFFDSFLGATLERHGWIGNDGVNFASTCFAALIASLLNRVVFP